MYIKSFSSLGSNPYAFEYTCLNSALAFSPLNSELLYLIVATFVLPLVSILPFVKDTMLSYSLSPSCVFHVSLFGVISNLSWLSVAPDLSIDSGISI